jgi:CubicO group peptidase (beta-lactamase class C family)
MPRERCEYGTNYSAEEVIRRVRYLPPASSFREKYGYSNLMFITAGEVVPAVTGKRWPDYVQKEFFQPLGMTDSVLSVSDLAAKSNVATPHGERRGKLVAYEWAGWDNSVAAGGIVASVSDMSKWMRLQLGRGTVDGRTYFSEKSSRTMWTQHTSQAVSKESEELIPSTHFRGYGLGWGLMDYRGRKIVSHGGGYDGMFSRVAMAPEEKLGVVILTNSMTSIPVALMYQILDAYLGGEERDWSQVYLERAEKDRKKKGERWAKRERARVADTQPSLPLEGYTGTYGGPMYGDATMTAEEGKLVLRLLPNPDLVADLTHWHFDTFEVDWRKEFSWFDKGHVQFILNHQGEVVEMKIDVPNDDFWFTELEFKKKKEE